MSKFLKAAAFALIAIVATVTIMGCEAATGVAGAAGADGSFNGNLPVVTDINVLFSDAGVAFQGWESGFGSHGYQNAGRFEGFGLNTYRAGSVITFDGVAADGTKALHFKSGPAVVGDDEGFNVNKAITGIYTTGWYKITVSRKFLTAATAAGKIGELSVWASDVYNQKQPGSVNTAIELPTVADAAFVDDVYYINVAAGYTNIGIGFYLSQGGTAPSDTESPELVVGQISIQKVALPGLTAITAAQVDAVGGYIWNLTDHTGQLVGAFAARDYSVINGWGAANTVTDVGGGISVVLANAANPWTSWKITAPKLPAGTYNITVSFASAANFVKLAIGNTKATATQFVPVAGNVVINSVVVTADGVVILGKLDEDPTGWVTLTGAVTNGVHSVVISSITFDRQ